MKKYYQNGHSRKPTNETIETIQDGVTDEYGLVSLNTYDRNYVYYDLYLSKIDYNDFHLQNNISGDLVEYSNMIPISTDGLVWIILEDFSFPSFEKICFFYEENGRLKGCYFTNETVAFPINKNYIVSPQMSSIDMIKNPLSAKNYIKYFIGIFFTILIILIPIILVLILLFKGNIKK